MVTQKRATRGRRGARGASPANHAAVAWALGATLAAEIDGRAARKIIAAANALASATSNTAFDFRPAVLLQTLLDQYHACDFDLEGTDKARARRAYAELIGLAGGPDDAPEPSDKKSAEWRHWTMRRIRADFYAEVGDVAGGPAEVAAMERYRRAWREVDSLVFPLWNAAPGDKSVHTALAVLAPLVADAQRAGR